MHIKIKEFIKDTLTLLYYVIAYRSILEEVICGRS